MRFPLGIENTVPAKHQLHCTHSIHIIFQYCARISKQQELQSEILNSARLYSGVIKSLAGHS